MAMISTLTSKGQATIPKPIRDCLRVKAHDQLIFRIEAGKVFVEAGYRQVSDLFGKYRQAGREPVSIEAMDRAIEEGVTEGKSA